jgi:hypothetical protein
MDLLFDAGDETRALWAWLDREEALRGKLRVTPLPPPPESMSAEFAIAADGAAVAALAQSVCRYLDARERTHHSDLELNLTGPDGQKVRVVVSRGIDPNAVLGLLKASPEGSDAPSRS